MTLFLVTMTKSLDQKRQRKKAYLIFGEKDENKEIYLFCSYFIRIDFL